MLTRQKRGDGRKRRHDVSREIDYHYQQAAKISRLIFKTRHIDAGRTAREAGFSSRYGILMIHIERGL